MEVGMSVWVNLFVVLFFGLLMFTGYKQGFLMKLINIIGFIVVGILAWWLSGPLSKLVGLYPMESVPLQGTLVASFLYENLNRFVVFVVLFVVLNIVILLIKPLIKALSSIPVLSTVNKVCGMILGGIQAILLLFLVALMLRLPFFANGSAIVDQSLLRYSEPMMETLLFYAKEPMKQLTVLFDMMDETKTLSQEEIVDVRQWLLSCGIEEDKVEAVIATLRTEE